VPGPGHPVVLKRAERRLYREGGLETGYRADRQPPAGNRILRADRDSTALILMEH